MRAAAQLRIGVEQARRERGVAEAGGHEDVGRGAALEQAPADVGPIDERVLRRRGLVIEAAHVDAGAAVEQPVGDVDGLRFVQRLLTVAAAGVDERGVGVDEPPQIVQPPESRRDVRRQRRAPCPGAIAPCPRRCCRARCRGRSASRCAGSRRRPRPSAPPAASTFFAATCAARWPKSNIGSLMRARTWSSATSCCVRGTSLQRTASRNAVTSRSWTSATSFGHEGKPASRAMASCASASASGREGSPASDRTVRMRASAAGIAGASRLDQILGELVLLFEIGGSGRVASGVDTDDLLRNAPVSASWAEERSVRDRRTTVTGGRRPSRGPEASCARRSEGRSAARRAQPAGWTDRRRRANAGTSSGRGSS